MPGTTKRTRKRLSNYVESHRPVELTVEDLEPSASMRHITHPKKVLKGKLHKHLLASGNNDYLFHEEGAPHGQFVEKHGLPRVRVFRNRRNLKQGGTRRKRRTNARYSRRR